MTISIYLCLLHTKSAVCVCVCVTNVAGQRYTEKTKLMTKKWVNRSWLHGKHAAYMCVRLQARNSFTHISYALIISMIMNLWIQSLFFSLWTPIRMIKKRLVWCCCRACHRRTIYTLWSYVLCGMIIPLCFFYWIWWWVNHTPEPIINNFIERF